MYAHSFAKYEIRETTLFVQRNSMRIRLRPNVLWILLSIKENTVFIKHEKVLIHTFYATKFFLEIEI